ncbi:hypothetical protein MTO96_020923 [Rhipicephalus appendiculatus]
MHWFCSQGFPVFEETTIVPAGALALHGGQLYNVHRFPSYGQPDRKPPTQTTASARSGGRPYEMHWFCIQGMPVFEKTAIVAAGALALHCGQLYNVHRFPGYGQPDRKPTAQTTVSARSGGRPYEMHWFCSQGMPVFEETTIALSGALALHCGQLYNVHRFRGYGQPDRKPTAQTTASARSGGRPYEMHWFCSQGMPVFEETTIALSGALALHGGQLYNVHRFPGYGQPDRKPTAQTTASARSGGRPYEMHWFCSQGMPVFEETTIALSGALALHGGQLYNVHRFPGYGQPDRKPTAQTTASARSGGRPYEMHWFCSQGMPVFEETTIALSGALALHGGQLYNVHRFPGYGQPDRKPTAQTTASARSGRPYEMHWFCSQGMPVFEETTIALSGALALHGGQLYNVHRFPGYGQPDRKPTAQTTASARSGGASLRDALVLQSRDAGLRGDDHCTIRSIGTSWWTALQRAPVSRLRTARPQADRTNYRVGSGRLYNVHRFPGYGQPDRKPTAQTTASARSGGRPYEMHWFCSQGMPVFEETTIALSGALALHGGQLYNVHRFPGYGQPDRKPTAQTTASARSGRPYEMHWFCSQGMPVFEETTIALSGALALHGGQLYNVHRFPGYGQPDRKPTAQTTASARSGGRPYEMHWFCSQGMPVFEETTIALSGALALHGGQLYNVHRFPGYGQPDRKPTAQTTASARSGGRPYEMHWFCSQGMPVFEETTIALSGALALHGGQLYNVHRFPGYGQPDRKPTAQTTASARSGRPYEMHWFCSQGMPVFEETTIALSGALALHGGQLYNVHRFPGYGQPDRKPTAQRATASARSGGRPYEMHWFCSQGMPVFEETTIALSGALALHGGQLYNVHRQGMPVFEETTIALSGALALHGGQLYNVHRFPGYGQPDRKPTAQTTASARSGRPYEMHWFCSQGMPVFEETTIALSGALALHGGQLYNVHRFPGYGQPDRKPTAQTTASARSGGYPYEMHWFCSQGMPVFEETTIALSGALALHGGQLYNVHRFPGYGQPDRKPTAQTTASARSGGCPYEMHWFCSQGMPVFEETTIALSGALALHGGQLYNVHRFPGYGQPDRKPTAQTTASARSGRPYEMHWFCSQGMPVFEETTIALSGALALHCGQLYNVHRFRGYGQPDRKPTAQTTASARSGGRAYKMQWLCSQGIPVFEQTTILPAGALTLWLFMMDSSTTSTGFPVTDALP